MWTFKCVLIGARRTRAVGERASERKSERWMDILFFVFLYVFWGEVEDDCLILYLENIWILLVVFFFSSLSCRDLLWETVGKKFLLWQTEISPCCMNWMLLLLFTRFLPVMVHSQFGFTLKELLQFFDIDRVDMLVSLPCADALLHDYFLSRVAKIFVLLDPITIKRFHP